MNTYLLEYDTPKGRVDEADQAEDMDAMVAKIEEEVVKRKGWKFVNIAQVDPNIFIPKAAEKFFK